MQEERVVVTNRQAFRDYHIVKTYEAGLKLIGSEVKSLRAGKANLKGSFARIEAGELFLYNLHISPYKFSQEEYDPLRPRKLLLHKMQIRQIETNLSEKGFTLVPLKIYFKRGYAKVEVGIAKGKKLFDKRLALKEKQVKKETERELHRKRKR